jgi:acyl carrier protein
MGEILARQGKPSAVRPDQTLQEVGFRSLDFSELVLRLEDEAGVEWSFDAAPLRRIATVKDVLEFLDALEHGG